jgi:hypothetical protein
LFQVISKSAVQFHTLSYERLRLPLQDYFLQPVDTRCPLRVLFCGLDSNKFLCCVTLMAVHLRTDCFDFTLNRHHDPQLIQLSLRGKIRGSFQKFCTLYVFSLKIDLFYKIHLQAFNVIYIVLYHSVPTFGEVLCSCLDAFVVDASDYSGHLIRHLLNASEAFPTEWFGNKSKSGGLNPSYCLS